MTTAVVDLEGWRGLYDAAERIRAMEPWTFMDETDLFGVEDPQTGQLGFVSVMGALGEHRAVAVYQGAKGLYDFLAIQTSVGDLPPERFLDMPQLQLSFENRGRLEREDRDLLAALGLTFTGRKAWPLFRSYRPACPPWFLDGDEIRPLRLALDQLLQMAPRFKDDPSCFEGNDSNAILIRSRVTDGDPADWRDSFVTVAPPAPEPVEAKIARDLIDAVKQLPHATNAVEVDCFRTPTVIAEPGRRPSFPYALMLGDAESGMLLKCELLDPVPSLGNMWGTVPGCVLRELVGLGWVPAQVVVKDTLLAALLRLLAPEIGFAVREARTLPLLDPAKRALLQHLDGGLSRRRRAAR